MGGSGGDCSQVPAVCQQECEPCATHCVGVTTGPCTQCADYCDLHCGMYDHCNGASSGHDHSDHVVPGGAHNASKCLEDGAFDNDCRAQEASAQCADGYVRTMQAVCDQEGSCDYTCTPPGSTSSCGFDLASGSTRLSQICAAGAANNNTAITACCGNLKCN